MSSFRFHIATPDGILFDDTVTSVKLFTEAGVTTVLARHADLLASVQFTHVIVRKQEEINDFIVRNGVLCMDHEANTLSLFVSFAEEKSETFTVTAKEYLDLLSEEMQKGHTLSHFHLEYLEEEHFVLKQQMEKSKA